MRGLDSSGFAEPMVRQRNLTFGNGKIRGGGNGVRSALTFDASFLPAIVNKSHALFQLERYSDAVEVLQPAGDAGLLDAVPGTSLVGPTKGSEITMQH